MPCMLLPALNQGVTRLTSAPILQTQELLGTGVSAHLLLLTTARLQHGMPWDQTLCTSPAPTPGSCLFEISSNCPNPFVCFRALRLHYSLIMARFQHRTPCARDPVQFSQPLKPWLISAARLPNQIMFFWALALRPPTPSNQSSSSIQCLVATTLGGSPGLDHGANPTDAQFTKPKTTQARLLLNTLFVVKVSACNNTSLPLHSQISRQLNGVTSSKALCHCLIALHSKGENLNRGIISLNNCTYQFLSSKAPTLTHIKFREWGN